MRIGELSRASLEFLCFELCEQLAECEWLARTNDPWDQDLSGEIREQNQLFQALHDTLRDRELLFSSVPEIRGASLKVYRRTEWNSRELIITGCVSREDKPPPRVASLVMRAKLYGLQFHLQDRTLTPLDLKPNDFKFPPEIGCQRNIAATNINSNKESKA